MNLLEVNRKKNMKRHFSFILPKRNIIRQKRIGGIEFVASRFLENGICFILVGWYTISKRKGHTGSIKFLLLILTVMRARGMEVTRSYFYLNQATNCTKLYDRLFK